MPRLWSTNFDRSGHGNASFQAAADGMVLGRTSHGDAFQRRPYPRLAHRLTTPLDRPRHPTSRIAPRKTRRTLFAAPMLFLSRRVCRIGEVDRLTAERLTATGKWWTAGDSPSRRGRNRWLCARVRTSIMCGSIARHDRALACVLARRLCAGGGDNAGSRRGSAASDCAAVYCVVRGGVCPADRGIQS
jgi:hypothetical protein